jgi:hypothetical protein
MSNFITGKENDERETMKGIRRLAVVGCPWHVLTARAAEVCLE